MAKLSRHDFTRFDTSGVCVGCARISDPVYTAQVKTRGIMQHEVHPKGSKWCAKCVYDWGVVGVTP